MSNDRLALYGALIVAAAAALFYFPLGLATLGVIMVAGAVLRATQSGQGE